MPFTPLHIPVAFATWILFKRRLPLAPLVLANMLPDLEVPFIYILSRIGLIRVDSVIVDRLVLHSIMGGLILTPIILMILYPFYTRIIKSIIGVECVRISSTKLVIAGSIGGLSHVLLDAVHHPYNPLLFPLTSVTVNSLIIGDYQVTGIVLHIVFAIILIGLFVYGYLRYGGVKVAIGFILGCNPKVN